MLRRSPGAHSARDRYKSRIRQRRSRILRGESLETRRLLATLSFTGSDLTYTANDGVENAITLSLAGDTYTFNDTGETITKVRKAPKSCTVDGLRTNTVTLTCGDARISTITFNLGDAEDTLAVPSARDSLLVAGGTESDTVSLANNLDLAGPLTIDAESISITDSGQIEPGIHTIGDQLYRGAVSLASNAHLATDGNIVFESFVDGGNSLSLDAGGETRFLAEVGGQVPLANLETTPGGTTILSSGSVTTTGNQTFQNAVLLDSDVTATGATLSFTDTVDAQVGTAANLTAEASNTFNAAGPIGATTPLASLAITTHEAMTLTTSVRATGSVYVTVIDSPTGGQDLVIDTTGSIHVVDGDIVLRAGDDLVLRPDASLHSAGVVEFSVDFGNADPAVGSAMAIGGVVTGSIVRVKGDSDDDVFAIDDNGDDVGGTVNQVLAPIDVAGFGGSDSLILNDNGEILPTSLTVTSSNLGAGSTDNLFASGVDLSYADLEVIHIFTGAGSDEVAVASTHLGSTTLNTGDGTDNAYVLATAGVTRLVMGGGDDRIEVTSPLHTLSDINGGLTVDGGSSNGGDVLILDHSGTTDPLVAILSSDTLAGASFADITYDQVDQLELLAGQADDEIIVASTHLGTTLIATGGGDDHIAVEGTSGNTTLVTGGGDDQIDVGAMTDTAAGISGDLAIQAGSANSTDTLVIDDSGRSQAVSAVLSLDSISGLGDGDIIYGDVEQLLLMFGQGADQLLIESTHAGVTDIRMNAGNDLVTGVTTDGQTTIDGGDGSDTLRAGNENTDETVLQIGALVLTAQETELGRFQYTTFESFDLTTDDDGDNAYFLQVGGSGSGGDLSGKFGFDPGLPGNGKVISLVDHRGFNTLSFVDADGAVRFDAQLLDGTEQTVDSLGNRVQVAGNFQLIVGSPFDDQLFSPLPQLQAGSDPGNLFGLQPVIAGFADPAVREEFSSLLASFGATMDAGELGSLLGAFGSALSSEELGELLGAFRRTVIAGEGDDLVVGGLFGSYDLGQGSNRFVQGAMSTAIESLLNGFGGGDSISASDLGAMLGGFRARVAAGDGDDSVAAGVLASFDLGDGNNLFDQTLDVSELSQLGHLLGSYTVDFNSNSIGALFGGLAQNAAADELGALLGGFGQSMGLEELGGLLGGFGTGETTVAELGQLLGGFGSALSAAEQQSLGQLLGGFGTALSGGELGELLGGFGGVADPVTLGGVLGGFGNSLSSEQLGELLGGFGTAVSAEQLGQLLGGFGAGLQAEQLGNLLGGFGNTLSQESLGNVLGGFGSSALTSEELGELLGAFSAAAGSDFNSLLDVAGAFGSTLSSEAMGSVLGGFGGLTSNEATVLGTLLGGFGTGATTVAELGQLLGGFGSALSAAEQQSLGQLLGGFGTALSGGELGELLGGFGGVADPVTLGGVLGGFGNSLSSEQLGELLGGFGTAVSAEQLGQLLGGFGAGLQAEQLGNLLGGFGNTLSQESLGNVLGGFGSSALTSEELGELLGAFSAAAGSDFNSLLDVAGAFGSTLSSEAMGSVLGGFGGLTSNEATVLGTLLGGFGTGATTVAELGQLLGGFGSALSAAEQQSLGQLLGGFGTALSGGELGELLGGFGGVADPVTLGGVLGGFGNSLSSEQLGELLGGFGTAVSAEQLGQLLGGFGAGLQAEQLGNLLGGFGNTLSQESLGNVLGGFGSSALTSEELGELLGAFSAAAGSDFNSLLDVAGAFGSTLSSEAMGSVLGGFGGLTSNEATVLGTLLGGFGTGATTVAELGQLLGGFGSALSAAEQQSLGQLLGGFGTALSGGELGELLGGFGGVADPVTLGGVLGGFGNSLSSEQLGELLGGFGTAVSAEQLGQLLGGFGAGLQAEQLGNLLGGFGNTLSQESLGNVLGGFGSSALTSEELGELLGAFSAAAGSDFNSLLDVAGAFGSTLSSEAMGSVLGGFGGLTSNEATVLGTLLGGFGTGATTVAELGQLLGGFGSALSAAEQQSLGQLLGGFGTVLGGGAMGQLLGGFADSVDTPALAIVTAAFLSQQDADLPATLSDFASSLVESELGTFIGGFVAVQNRDALTEVLVELTTILNVESHSQLEQIVVEYTDGLLTTSELGERLATWGTGVPPEQLEQVLGALASNLDLVSLSEVLANFTLTLGSDSAANLISGFVDSQHLPALRALLSSLRSTVTTGDGEDVASGIVLTTLKTRGGNDRLLSGIVDATVFVDAFVSAGFSLPTAEAALAAAGAVLEGGDGNDIYYFVGHKLGHLKINEFSLQDVDESYDTLDFSGFAGGPVTVDAASESEQTVTQGRLWLKLADGMSFEAIIGTADGDRILANARDNLILGSDPLDSRAEMSDSQEARTQWVLLDFDSETGTGDYVYDGTEREAIRAHLEQLYRGPDSENPWFNFRFVLALPGGVSEYITVQFNRTPDGEQAGGFSEEIDFRNVNLSSGVVVDVNGLIGGPRQPAATSENFVNMSATIAAHEVGHAAGARHHHAIGSIGFGTHIPPGRTGYAPDFGGLAGAVETTVHMMASPASVGSSLLQAASGAFISERTATILAFAEQGVVVSEDPVATESVVGQALGELPGLDVPNTISRGLNADKDLSVAAIAVVGRLDAANQVTGVAENDLYSFHGQAGDLINIEVMSSSLTRYAGDSIDAVVRVLDSAGDVVPYFGSPFGAFNDDQFEPGDAAIVDLQLPADGTYFIEVDSFHFGLPEFAGEGGYGPAEFDVDAFCSANPDSAACNDTDTGDYELFIYRFDAGNAQDGGDLLDGREGTDTLFGFAGDDTIVVGSGQDFLDAGPGSDTIFEKNDVDFVLIDTQLVGAGTAEFVSIERAILEGGQSTNVIDASGFSGDSTLIGVAGDDLMMGGPGDDLFILDDRSLSDTDTIIGGEGRDRLDFGGRTEGIDLNLGHFGSGQNIGGGQKIFLVNEDIEEVIGTLASDKLLGNSLDNLLVGDPGDDPNIGAADKLVGRVGNDVLVGHAGADNLVGGPDNDVLIGGRGADRLVGSTNEDILFANEVTGTYEDNGAFELDGGFDNMSWWNNFDLLRALSLFWSMGGAYAEDLGIESDEDGDSDDLTGGSGDDWFFIGASDVVTDLDVPHGDRVTGQ